jgi:predicted transcriptional regulator
MVKREELLAGIFDEKTVKIVNKLLPKKDIFYLRELALESQVSLATTFRIVQKLLKLGLVRKETKNKFTFYYLNKDTQLFKELSMLFNIEKPDPLKQIKEALKNLYPSDLLNVYATSGKDKKLFIIGTNIQQSAVQSLLADAQIKTNFMIINPDQFQQMQQMGLIPSNLKEI